MSVDLEALRTALEADISSEDEFISEWFQKKFERPMNQLNQGINQLVGAEKDLARQANEAHASLSTALEAGIVRVGQRLSRENKENSAAVTAAITAITDEFRSLLEEQVLRVLQPIGHTKEAVGALQTILDTCKEETRAAEERERVAAEERQQAVAGELNSALQQAAAASQSLSGLFDSRISQLRLLALAGLAASVIACFFGLIAILQ